MSELLKYKEWITLEQASKYLSGELKEVVTKKDILHFVADSKIKMSIRLKQGYGYGKASEFCPVYLENEIIESFIPELTRLMPVNKHADDSSFGRPVFEIDFLEPEPIEWQDWPLCNELEAIKNGHARRWLKEFAYQKHFWNYDPEAKTADYREEYKLDGVYSLSTSTNNSRFLKWVENKALSDGTDIVIVPDDGFELCYLNLMLSDEVTEIELECFHLTDQEVQQSAELKGKHSYNSKTVENLLITELPSRLVIKTEHLITFIEDQLGTNPNLEKLPLLKIDDQREHVLRKLVEELGEQELKRLGRLGTWHELTKKDHKLFPAIDDANIGTPKGFYRKQNQIVFGSGRRS